MVKKWSENEKNKAIELLSNNNSYKQIAKILDRTPKSIQRKLEGYHSTYRTTLYQEINCKCCSEKFKSLITENRIFCSKKCQLQNIIDDKKIDHNKVKLSNCKDCGCEIKIKNNTNYSTVRCEKCKNIHSNSKCKFCGEIINKKNSCDDCKPYVQLVNFFEKLEIMKYGTKLNILNNEAVNILSDMYYNNKYSRLQISELTNIDKKSLYLFFIKNNFKLRELSECISNAIYLGRLERCEIKNKYKSGWHKSWNNNDVYYRSSYELDYCILLDSCKIQYSMEKLRIKYWDSILEKERIAIPDFYLPETNEIVEIKSDWTYDEQNMNDKIIEYKNNGFKVKLILEHKEYLIT
jgi:hypothetical protein